MKFDIKKLYDSFETKSDQPDIKQYNEIVYEVLVDGKTTYPNSTIRITRSEIHIDIRGTEVNDAIMLEDIVKQMFNPLK